MKVEILRAPGLDLIHDLKGKGVIVPTDCIEGDEKELSEKAADALIERHLARQVGKKVEK
ncbi:MAG: hypothetical protein ACRET3_15025 [Burkholderiales bacterium]